MTYWNMSLRCQDKAKSCSDIYQKWSDIIIITYYNGIFLSGEVGTIPMTSWMMIIKSLWLLFDVHLFSVLHTHPWTSMEMHVSVRQPSLACCDYCEHLDVASSNNGLALRSPYVTKQSVYSTQYQLFIISHQVRSILIVNIHTTASSCLT